MSQIPYPVLNINGVQTALVPVDDFLALAGDRKPGTGWAGIPMDVAQLVWDGASPLKAWRIHSNLTQAQLAEKMGITRGAYSQMEKPGTKPHRGTIENAAAALGLDYRQILELYEDEEATTPPGWVPVDPDDPDLD